MGSSAWAVATAVRIGRRAALATLLSGRKRRNPFLDRGMPDLAEAWDDGYRSSLGTPGTGGEPGGRSS